MALESVMAVTFVITLKVSDFNVDLVKLLKIDLHCVQRKCSPKILVFDNI